MTSLSKLLYLAANMYPWQQQVWNSEAKVRLVLGGRTIGMTQMAMHILGSTQRHQRAALLTSSNSRAQSIHFHMNDPEFVQPIYCPSSTDVELVLMAWRPHRGQEMPYDLVIVDDCFGITKGDDDKGQDWLAKLILPHILDSPAKVLMLGTPSRRSWISELAEAAPKLPGYQTFGIETWNVNMYDVGHKVYADQMLGILPQGLIPSEVFGIGQPDENLSILHEKIQKTEVGERKAVAEAQILQQGLLQLGQNKRKPDPPSTV